MLVGYRLLYEDPFYYLEKRSTKFGFIPYWEIISYSRELGDLEREITKLNKTMKVTNKAVFFWGGICSQWAKSEFTIEGVTYNCAEQYMMAKKALLFGDGEAHAKIMSKKNPRDQKALGRKVRGFNSDEWNEVCRDYVYEANYAKFTQNPAMLSELESYGDKELVEASPYDKVWGIGMHWEDDGVEDKANWKGSNWLGEALMQVRDTLKNADV